MPQTADKASKRLGALFFIMSACCLSLEMVTLVVLLRDQHIRFDFIREATQHLY